MKRSFLIVAALFLVAPFQGNEARSQEQPTVRLGLYGGGSNPSGEYRNGVGRAGDGYAYGMSLEYFFWGSNLGIGVDARFTGHSYQRPDTVYSKQGSITATTANVYSSPTRFRHLGITAGPVYHLGQGKIGLDLYARGGLLFQQFPAYVRRVVMVVTTPVIGSSNTSTFTYVTDKSSASAAKAQAWTAQLGGRLTFSILPSVELFAYGDYQMGIGSKGAFTVVDLTGAEPPKKAATNMVSFGGGLRLLFGEGRDPSGLSRNY